MIKPNTQAGRLLEHLLAGRSITRLESFRELGIVELSARIIDIQSNGYIINKHRITVKNRYGEDCSVVEYSLAMEKVAA